MLEDMTVAFAWFEPLEGLDLPGGTWPFQLHVVGTGFAPRAVPLAVTVGNLEVVNVRVNSGGGGFSGLLREKPAEGAVLMVGWLDGPMMETNVTFHQGNV